MVIRAALIDIGNVLKPFSHPKMCEQMAALAGVPAHRLRAEFLDTGLFDDFERGLVTGEQVHAWFCDHFAVAPSVDELRIACSDMFGTEPLWPALLDGLKARGIRLVALSNTCDWHIRWIEETDVVLQRLDAVATSWQVGQRKPHRDIYLEAVRLAGCEPEECLYLDDIEDYVHAGRSHGIQAHLYVDVPTTRALLQSLGCEL